MMTKAQQRRADRKRREKIDRIYKSTKDWAQALGYTFTMVFLWLSGLHVVLEHVLGADGKTVTATRISTSR